MSNILYEKLRKWMHNVTSTGLRETDKTNELDLLKYLFSPDESKQASHPPIDSKPPDIKENNIGFC